MTISTRTVIKSYFETGDRPTQAQFSDFIDSTLFYEDTSDFGRALISASAAGSARALLGSGVVGDKLFISITTASAQQNIGGGAVGRRIFEAIATASALTELGGGVVGINVFGAITTASAQDQLKIPVTASKSDQEAGTSGITYVSPSAQQYHPSAIKAWADISYSAGVPTIHDSYNISSIIDSGTGDLAINLTVSMSSTYAALFASGEDSGIFIYQTNLNSSSQGRIRFYNVAGVPTDPAAHVYWGIFGDQ